jgi:hypothetical protein
MGAFSEEMPCSKTGEQGRREEISDGDPGGGGDPDGAGSGVLTSLDEGFPFGEGERSRLIPLWSSIDGEQRAREEILEQTKERNGRWFSAGNEGDIYSREDVILAQ